MFSGIAYKAACTLGIDHKDFTGGDQPALGSQINLGPQTSELFRRCFWAVWFTQCINADHSATGLPQSERVMNLPLPIGEIAFHTGAEQPLRTLTELYESRKNAQIVQDTAAPSIMAELMTLMLSWADIRTHIRSIQRANATEWIARMFEIEGQLSNWSTQLHETLKYSKRNLYEQLVVNQQPVYVFFHVLYHQCRLVLHSSLVPKFGGLRLPGAIPTEATSLSARIALNSAQKISEIGTNLLALEWPPSQIPSFVGYCMYVSASVHITLLSSRDLALATLAKTNLITSLKVLSAVKVYWTNLERLWVRINLLYEAQVSRYRTPPGEPGTSLGNYRTEQTDLDHIAHEARDTGALSEPLADSVLQYSLRHLKQNAKPRFDIVQALEKEPYPNELTQLLSLSTAPQQSSFVQGMPSEQAPIAMGFDEEANNVPILHNSATGDWIKGSLFQMDQGVPYDWLQMNPNGFLQPFSSYDEVFDLDCNI
ncbi:hypothetical protein LTR84_003759 [Exophiala bonariae]|uniref:Transcription factor domain-containing protein n=1 Tax=Exophiala bonariae TaxID=1690606 RepID=A0AAV9N887_9EURO|nr:hypothetical protein LTR84_003759 [Exophiala bonariae]